MAHKPISIKKIEIARAYPYDASCPFTAEVQLEGGRSYPADITLKLPPEALDAIIPIVQGLVVSTIAAAASEFAADVQASIAGQVVDAIAHQPAEPTPEELGEVDDFPSSTFGEPSPIDLDDDVPF